MTDKSFDVAALGPATGTQKLDFNSLLYRQMDRIGFLLAIALQHGDMVSNNSIVIRTGPTCFALKNAIAGLEALLISKGLKNVESYWRAREELFRSGGGSKDFERLEERALMQEKFHESQRKFISVCVDWFGLLMEFLPTLRLVRKGVEKDGRGIASGKESN